jgi:2-iminobutanoate/2-iminopropanoate deaminase
MKSIFSDKAPAAIGPYCHATVSGNLVFTSGQLGRDMDADVKAQTEQALENLSVVLESSGSCLCKVIKTTCFLSDIKDFAAFNEVYAKAFGDHKPARSCFQVAALPKGAKVEIEAVAELC